MYFPLDLGLPKRAAHNQVVEHGVPPVLQDRIAGYTCD
jgi:hypothetical protein